MIKIEDLIKIKLGKKERVYKTINVPELGGTVKVLVPTTEELEDIVDIEIKNKDGKVDKEKTTREKSKKLIYYQVVEPKLSDERLISHHNCKDSPEDVVFKIMSSETVESLATAILALFDKETIKYKVRVVEEVKN